MTGLNSFRQKNSFQQKIRRVLRDPNQGLDYVSTAKYNRSKVHQTLQSEMFIKNLLHSSKQKSKTQVSQIQIDEKLYQKTEKLKSLIQNLSVKPNLKNSIKNPLIQKLFSKNNRKCIQKITNANNQKKLETKKDKKYQIKSACNNLLKDQSFMQNKVRIVLERDTVNCSNTKNQKSFRKYPSSSLLRVNPALYKASVETYENQKLYDKQLISSEEKPYGNYEKFFFKFNPKAHLRKKRFDSLPSQISKFNIQSQQQKQKQKDCLTFSQVSLKNKLWKDKQFFNTTISFMKRKNDAIKLQKIDLNDFIQQNIEQNSLKIKLNKILASGHQNSIEKNIFENLILAYMKQKNQRKIASQQRLSAYGSRNRSLTKHQGQSKQFYTTWTTPKNQKQSSLQKLKKSIQKMSKSNQNQNSGSNQKEQVKTVTV